MQTGVWEDKSDVTASPQATRWLADATNHPLWFWPQTKSHPLPSEAQFTRGQNRPRTPICADCKSHSVLLFTSRMVIVQHYSNGSNISSLHCMKLDRSNLINERMVHFQHVTMRNGGWSSGDYWRWFTSCWLTKSIPSNGGQANRGSIELLRREAAA